jgi:hypothetical protein
MLKNSLTFTKLPHCSRIAETNTIGSINLFRAYVTTTLIDPLRARVTKNTDGGGDIELQTDFWRNGTFSGNVVQKGQAR